MDRVPAWPVAGTTPEGRTIVSTSPRPNRCSPAHVLRMADLWRERGSTREHIAGLEGEYDRMREHIANLESERTRLLGNMSNVERILGMIRGHRIYGLLSRVKDTFLRS